MKITDSTESKNVTVISKYYFLLKNQELNLTMKEEAENWSKLKKNVMNVIDSKLKGKMAVEVQMLNLMITKGGVLHLAGNFREIGKAWKKILMLLETTTR